MKSNAWELGRGSREYRTCHQGGAMAVDEARRPWSPLGKQRPTSGGVVGQAIATDHARGSQHERRSLMKGNRLNVLDAVGSTHLEGTMVQCRRNKGRRSHVY